MIINEKGLARLMEAEFKSGGYHVAVSGSELSVWGNDWKVYMPNGLCPRKVTGLLAEHFGYLPEMGAYQVYGLKQNGKVEAVVQTELEEGPIAENNTFPEPEEWNEAHKTGLTYMGDAAWQTEDNRLIFADPGSNGLLEPGAGRPTRADDCLMWQDTDGCRVWIVGADAANSGMTPEAVEAAQSVRWY